MHREWSVRARPASGATLRDERWPHNQVLRLVDFATSVSAQFVLLKSLSLRLALKMTVVDETVRRACLAFAEVGSRMDSTNRMKEQTCQIEPFPRQKISTIEAG